jgi:ribosomal protein S18 acetylase RimI-like enzyme
MNIVLRTATLDDAGFIADVVIRATLAQGRFPSNVDLAEYRAGYEEWTRETVLGNIPDCTLSVIEQDGLPVGRLRVVREAHAITLAGIQLLPEHQNKRIGSTLVTQLMQEAGEKGIPLQLSVEKDNPNALRFYQRHGFILCGESDDAFEMEYRSQA